jgi:hypothetical protein
MNRNSALNRRDLITAIAASSALSLAGLASTALRAADRGGVRDTDPLLLIDVTLARALIGSEFAMNSELANTSAKMELMRVILPTLKGAQKPLEQSDTFGLEFLPSSSQGELVQETYHVTHKQLGSFDLFLVPHVNSKGQHVLLATFSR